MVISCRIVVLGRLMAKMINRFNPNFVSPLLGPPFDRRPVAASKAPELLSEANNLPVVVCSQQRKAHVRSH